jgi:hypothetical protein
VDFLVEEFQFASNCPKSMKPGAPGFSFSNLWCSQTGDHPHEGLAKIGYGPGMKVDFKKRILLYFGNPTGTCSIDMAI